MRYLIFLLITFACNAIVTSRLHREISFTDEGKINGIHEYINRNKRDIKISKNSDSLTVQAVKDIFDDENKKLSVVGGINGLKEGSYDNIEAGLSFADRNGDNLNVVAQHDVSGNSLTGKANVNILKIDEHVLKADGFFDKDFASESGNNRFKYGGVLDYINKNKFEGKLLAEHDSNVGDKLSAVATYNILKSGNNDLSARGFWDRSIPLDGAPHDVFGGSLDYLNGNKFKGNFLAQHDSNFGDKLSAAAKYNIFNAENKDLSARGFWSRSMPFGRSPINSYGGSLDYLNRNNGNRATLVAEHIPNFGNEISASGRYNIWHNDDHNLAVELEASRKFPSNPALDSYNTYTGNLGYNYKDLGVNLGVRQSEGSFKPTVGITFQKEF